MAFLSIFVATDAAQQSGAFGKSLNLGVEVVGGIPHFERTMAASRARTARRCTAWSGSAAFVYNQLSIIVIIYHANHY